MSAATSPNFAQRIRYALGGTLPDSMQDWVRNDLTGPGATRRYLLRFLVPMFLVLLLFLFIPGPMWMRWAMIALLYLPLCYFTVALMYVYRRHRLVSHGLDPALADASARQRTELDRRDYEQRHGRGSDRLRPTVAFQKNAFGAIHGRELVVGRKRERAEALLIGSTNTDLAVEDTVRCRIDALDRSWNFTRIRTGIRKSSRICVHGVEAAHLI